MSINYAEVVADIRHRAAKLIATAEILERFVSTEEGQAALPVPPAPPTLILPKEGVANRRNQKMPREGIAVSAAVIQALSASDDEYLTQLDLLDAVRKLRPGTTLKQFHQGTSQMKLTGKPRRDRVTGNWALPKKEAEAPTYPHPAEKKETIADLVRRAVLEPTERTAPEVIDRVIQMRPDAIRATVSTTISQLVTARQFARTDMGKIRPIVDGRIQYGIGNGANA